ncbi:23S rRNA pseudouridine2457 synthase [Sphingomonas trueperi]
MMDAPADAAPLCFNGWMLEQPQACLPLLAADPPRDIAAARRYERAMPRLLLFNKPFGVLSQFTDRGSPTVRSTLSDFIQVKGVYPAGRLDRDSEGLLLLCDDGRLQARIADPRFKMPKTYLVQVEGDPQEAELARLRQGVLLNDGMTLPAEAARIDAPDLWLRDPPIRQRKSIPDAWLKITIREGRNRQVRRMTAAVGLPTLRLVRWSIGDWSVAGIAPGRFEEVSASDRTQRR